MVRVSTFCPRCGESIETDVPEEARQKGRSELSCPACRFEFVIAPARDAPTGDREQVAPQPSRATGGARPAKTPAAPAAEGAANVPPGPPRRPPPSFKPVAAGLLLFFVALLGIWAGITIFTSDIVEASLEDGGAAPFSGRVVDADGAPLQEVRVELVDGPGLEGIETENRTLRTDADGRYRFDALPPGVYTFRFALENHTTVVLETPVYSDEYPEFFRQNVPFGEVTMHAGDPEEVREVSQVDRLEKIARLVAGAIIVASVVTAAGGWAAMRRRGLPLAITGCITGVFVGLTFLLGSILALVALFLVIASRKEFHALLRRD